MKTRPILFSGPMVRAILDGKKTQTRRVIKGQPSDHHWQSFPDYSLQHRVLPCATSSGPKMFVTWTHRHGESWDVDSNRPICPHGQPGDHLFVRETTCIAPKRFAPPDDTCVTDYDGDPRYVSYKADGHPEDAMRDYNLKWTPSILVPRWASRITLEIESIRVERLNGISDADANAEGVFEWWDGLDRETQHRLSANGNRVVDMFQDLWESINGPGSWDANPWVWVVQFRRVK